MTQFIVPIMVWLHALATVIFIGYFVLLALIYLPALSANGPGLSEISRRSRRWLYTSLIVFFVTGIYMMITDPNYLGFMDFGNAWGIVMLVKHILIVAMIVMGFWFNAILRVGPLMNTNTGAEQAVVRFRKYINAMAVCGVLVLLLTALAQVE